MPTRPLLSTFDVWMLSIWYGLIGVGLGMAFTVAAFYILLRMA